MSTIGVHLEKTEAAMIIQPKHDPPTVRRVRADERADVSTFVVC